MLRWLARGEAEVDERERGEVVFPSPLPFWVPVGTSRLWGVGSGFNGQISPPIRADGPGDEGGTEPLRCNYIIFEARKEGRKKEISGK